MSTAKIEYVTHTPRERSPGLLGADGMGRDLLSKSRSELTSVLSRAAALFVGAEGLPDR
jgi:hypothetical protein